MPENFELRELVAVKLGYTLKNRAYREDKPEEPAWHRTSWFEPGRRSWRFSLPAFEVELNEAWCVIARMVELGWYFSVSCGPTDMKPVVAEFQRPNPNYDESRPAFGATEADRNPKYVSADEEGEAAPTAICKAMLKALENWERYA